MATFSDLPMELQLRIFEFSLVLPFKEMLMFSRRPPAPKLVLLHPLLQTTRPLRQAGRRHLLHTKTWHAEYNDLELLRRMCLMDPEAGNFPRRLHIKPALFTMNSEKGRRTFDALRDCEDLGRLEIAYIDICRNGSGDATHCSFYLPDPALPRMHSMLATLESWPRRLEVQLGLTLRYCCFDSSAVKEILECWRSKMTVTTRKFGFYKIVEARAVFGAAIRD